MTDEGSTAQRSDSPALAQVPGRDVERSPSVALPVEIEAHHDPTLRRPADGGEPGVREHALSAEVLFRDGAATVHDRVALHRSGAPASPEPHGGTGERPTDATSSKSRTGDETSHCPDVCVVPVLVPIRAWHLRREQPRVGSPGLDGALPDRFFRQVGHQAGGSCCLGLAALRLFAQARRPFGDRHGGPFGIPNLESLATTSSRVVTIEHDGRVVDGGFVRGHDP